MTKRQTYKVGATALNANTFVKLSSELLVVASAATDKVIGVVEYAYAAGDWASVIVEGQAEVLWGGTDTIVPGDGAALRSGTGGRAFLADASTDVVCAVADIPIYDSSLGIDNFSTAGRLVPISLLPDKTRAIP